MLLGADQHRQRREGARQGETVLQVAAAVLDADHLAGVAPRQLDDTGVAELHAAQAGDVIEQQLELRVGNAAHHLRHRVHHTRVTRLAEVKRRHEHLAVATQGTGVTAQLDGVGQGTGAGGHDDLVRPHACAQHALQQGLALSNAEGRAFSGGAKQGDAVATGGEHVLTVGDGALRVDAAVGGNRDQQGRP